MPEAQEYEKMSLEELMGLIQSKSINLGPETGTEVPEQIGGEVPEPEEERMPPICAFKRLEAL